MHWIKLHSGIFQFFCWWTKNHRWYLVLNRWSAHSRHPLKRNKEIESQSIWASTIKTWVFTNYLPSSSLSWLLLQSSAMRRKFPREWLEKVKIITKENLPLYNIYPDDEKISTYSKEKKIQDANLDILQQWLKTPSVTVHFFHKRLLLWTVNVRILSGRHSSSFFIYP